MDTNKKIAALESLVDHLKTELTYIHQLMKACGFPDGIATLKETAEELLKEQLIFEEKALPEFQGQARFNQIRVSNKYFKKS